MCCVIVIIERNFVKQMTNQCMKYFLFRLYLIDDFCLLLFIIEQLTVGKLILNQSRVVNLTICVEIFKQAD